MTAGSQPISAYFLLKENEIRKGRLILTAKNHILDEEIIFRLIL